MRLLIGSLVGLLVIYQTKQKDGYSLPTNSPTNNRTNWIWMSKKIGPKIVNMNYGHPMKLSKKSVSDRQTWFGLNLKIWDLGIIIGPVI